MDYWLWVYLCGAWASALVMLLAAKIVGHRTIDHKKFLISTALWPVTWFCVIVAAIFGLKAS